MNERRARKQLAEARQRRNQASTVLDLPVAGLFDDMLDVAGAGDASEPAPTEMPHPRNTLNDMNGRRFLYFTKSVLTTAYPRSYSHHLRKKQGANKPPQIMALLIEFFTKSRMAILDPFAGVGGTLIGASIAAPAARRCVGIEINPAWTEIYAQVLAENPDVLPQTMVQGDCLRVMESWLMGGALPVVQGEPLRQDADGSLFDFIAMDPPYTIHLAQTMSGAGSAKYAGGHNNRRSDYNMRSDEVGDLANLATYDDYLNAMEQVFERCYRLLRPGRYLAIIVRDAYQNGEYQFTHVDLARRARSVGFVPKGNIIWYQAGTRLRPYGYPYSYIPNIAHQVIVIAQKPRPPRPIRRKKAVVHSVEG